jgi:hypothetical protein
MYIMYGRRYDEIGARYQRSFGVRAGYLPQDRAELDQWHAELSLRSADLPEKHKKSIQKLDDLPKSTRSSECMWTR